MIDFFGLNPRLIIVSSIVLVCLVTVVILTIFDLRLRKRINTDLRELLTKERTNLSNLGEQILTVLIRHGGKMSSSEISSYLDMPADLVSQKLKVMERDKLVIRKGLSEVYEIYLNNSDNSTIKSGKGEKHE
jgi:uncharacterized membrane protein